MKISLQYLAMPITCLLNTGCFSAMLNISGSTSGDKVEAHERVAAANADVVTAPIQAPFLLLSAAPRGHGESFPEQSEEEKKAIRESQERELRRRVTGF
jgi:hypothetical protein